TFSPMEPTTMLRRRVPFPLPCDPACFRRCKGLIQRGGGVRMEILSNQSHHVRLWQRHGDPLLHLDGEGIPRTPRCDVDGPPPTQRLDEEKERCHTFAALFIIGPRGLSRPGGQGLPRLTDQWHRACIKTDLRTPHSVRLPIPIQYILHGPDKVRT